MSLYRRLRSLLAPTTAGRSYRRARRLARILLRRDVQFGLQDHAPIEIHGAWRICPTLEADSVVYSVGIGNDLYFDESLVRRFGVRVHAFDPTPACTEYWSKQADIPSGVVLHPIGVADYDGQATFYPPVPGDISFSMHVRATGCGTPVRAEVRRLSTLMRELGHTRIDVLKLDVEGAEYSILADALNQDIPIRQILVEFHHRFPGIGIQPTKKAVRDLNAAGFRIVFADPNGEDYTFLRH